MLPFLKKLFSTSAAAPTTEWQPLRRSAAEERRRQQWLQEQVYLNWMGPYFKAYHYQKAGLPNSQFRVQLLHDDGRQGALFFYDPSIGPGNFRYLFDFLRDRVLDLGYNLSISDQRSVHHASYTETIYKHFLKPKPRDCTHTGRCNQLYGNITIDLVSINGQPGFLRLFSNPFDNAIFTPAHTFEEMLAALLDMPPAPPEVQKLIKKYQAK